MLQERIYEQEAAIWAMTRRPMTAGEMEDTLAASIPRVVRYRETISVLSLVEWEKVLEKFSLQERTSRTRKIRGIVRSWMEAEPIPIEALRVDPPETRPTEKQLADLEFGDRITHGYEPVVVVAVTSGGVGVLVDVADLWSRCSTLTGRHDDRVVVS